MSDLVEPTLSNLPTLGIVGCSLARVRYGAALTISKRFQVTALTDPDTRILRSLTRELGGTAERYADFDALLQCENFPDALLLELPLEERSNALRKSLPRTRAILCPPPFAKTLQETETLLQLAIQHRCLLMPAFPRRFDPVVSRAIELAQTGSIGNMLQIRCEWSLPLQRIYGIELGGDPDAETWETLLPYLMCHAADFCRMGFGDILTVSADIDTERTEDTSRSKQPLLAVALLGQEWGTSSCHFSRSRATVPLERYVLIGDAGQLVLTLSSATHSSNEPPNLQWVRQSAKDQTITLDTPENRERNAPAARMHRMFEHFADCVEEKAVSIVSSKDARNVWETYHAARFSALTKNKVTLPLAPSLML